MVYSRLREIPARYESRCSKCKQMIVAGEPILWEPGYAEHKVCPENPLGHVVMASDFPSKGYTMVFEDPLWLVRDNAADEAVYSIDIEQAFDFIRERLKVSLTQTPSNGQ